MSLDPAVLRALAAAGATTEMIIAAVEADAALEAARKEAKRENNRVRQARFQAKKKAQNNADNALVALDNAGAENGAPHVSSKSISPRPLKGASPLIPDEAVDGAVSEWNSLAAELGLSRVAKVTPERRRALKRILADHGRDGWRTALSKIRGSPFCRGQASGRDWQANFDFATDPKKFLKLIEGGYDPAPSRTAPTGPDVRDPLLAAALGGMAASRGARGGQSGFDDDSRFAPPSLASRHQ